MRINQKHSYHTKKIKSGAIERPVNKPNTTKSSILDMSEIGLPMMPGSNVIESDRHTLISNFNKSEMIPLEGEHGLVPGMFESTPEFTIHKLFLGDMEDMSNHGFNKIINKLQEASHEDVLEMHIAGHGGFISECIKFYNLIDSMYSSRCTTYLSYGYSANAMAFLMGNERIVYDNSEIMFHSYAGGMGGKRDDLLTQIEHTDKYIQRFFESLLAPYFSADEIQRISDGKDYWFNSIEMLQRDIATGIIVKGRYYTKDEYFEKHDDNGQVLESWIKKQEDKAQEDADTELRIMKAIEEASKPVKKPVKKAVKKPVKKPVKKAVKKPATTKESKN